MRTRIAAALWRWHWIAWAHSVAAHARYDYATGRRWAQVQGTCLAAFVAVAPRTIGYETVRREGER